jgi:hypothetical protein
MRLTSPFFQSYRFVGRPPVQLERVLAVGRAFLTVSALVAIYLDPTEPARLRAITYSVLLAYALYSLVVLAYVHRAARLTPGHGRVLHGLDIAWTSALTVVSEGPVSPFFLFFLFVVVAAAYRGGFRETAGTAVIIAAVFLVETAIAAAGPWNSPWLASSGFELNRTILRVAYLLLTGVLLGYLAEQEKQSRAELAAIADATRQPRVDLGLGGSVTAVARMLLSTFGASAVSVVVDDHDNRRSLLWRFDGSMAAKEQPRARRVDLNAEERSTWLFKDFGHAWHATTNHVPGAGADLRVIDPGVWPLRRLRVELPAGLLSAHLFETVTAVNMGLPGEWHGRIYLFDALQADSPERSLHFLEALANVRRHSHAMNMLVSLASDDGACRLVIEDDGCGFEFEGRLSAQELDASHVGPAIIKERARMAGAQLTVESTRGVGARLELTIREESDHG